MTRGLVRDLEPDGYQIIHMMNSSKKFTGESAWNLKRNMKTKSQKKIWMKILCRIVMISTHNVQNHLREESYNHCRAIMLNNM